jgi:ferritin-like metal-binding protein YciE
LADRANFIAQLRLQAKHQSKLNFSEEPFMKIKTMQDVFVTGLKYVYDAEQKLVKKGLPKMAESATSAELRSALEQHLEETRGHVTRLERIFSTVRVEPKAEDNDVVDEMMKTVEHMIGATEDGSPLRDVVLIVGGNEVEHYEIAAYGSLRAIAQQLGLNDAATLLEQTLQEEKAADSKLTEIGESSANTQAARSQRAA